MDLGESVPQLEELHAHLASILRDFVSPQPASVSPERLGEASRIVESGASELPALLEHFREAAVAEAFGEEDRGMLAPFALAPDSPLARFAASGDPVSAKLAQLEAEFAHELRQAQGAVSHLQQLHHHDMEIIVKAEGVAQAGNYSQATRLMDSTTRLFKGTNYWQVDRIVGNMGKQLELAKHGTEQSRSWHETTFAEAMKIRQPDPRQAKLRELLVSLRAAEKEVAPAREIRASVAAGSEYATAYDRIVGPFDTWLEEMRQKLQREISSAGAHRRRKIIVACAAALLLAVGTAVALLALTGYRVIGPDGIEQSARFVWPGGRTFTFTLPYHEPHTVKTTISLGRVTDLGVIPKSDLRRTTGKLEVKSLPEGARFVLAGKEINEGIRREGTAPAQFADLPSGPYHLAANLGEATAAQDVDIQPAQENTATLSFAAGTLNLASEPPGAEVFLGSKSLGKTPLIAPGVAAGEHKLTLDLNGAKHDVTVTVPAGETVTQSVSFPRASFSVQTNPPGAQIQFAGNLLPPGESPYEAKDVIAREYEAELRFPGLAPLHRKFSVAPGANPPFTVTIPHGSATITTTPEVGVLLTFSDPAIESGSPPRNLPVLPPGHYKATARAVNGTTAAKEFTVREGERTEVTIALPTGRLQIVSDPPGASFAVRNLSGAGGKTPAEIDLVAGTYDVEFFLNNVRQVRSATLEVGKQSSIHCRFLEDVLKSGILKIPPSTPDRFPADTTLKEGVGLKVAPLGGPVLDAIQAFGLPETIRRVPHATYGSSYFVSWPRQGLTLTTDGDQILSLTFTEPSAGQTSGQMLFTYWARTSKGITIGSTVEQLQEAYGKPQSSAKGLAYEGITFTVGARDRGTVVTSIRIEAPR